MNGISNIHFPFFHFEVSSPFHTLIQFEANTREVKQDQFADWTLSRVAHTHTRTEGSPIETCVAAKGQSRFKLIQFFGCLHRRMLLLKKIRYMGILTL